MSVFDTRLSYKPFQYQWCFDAYERQNNVHWMPKEQPMGDDQADYGRMAESERRVVTQILRFFTQADLGVADSYMDHIIQRFHLPEVRMMLSTFGAFEAIHADAYDYLAASLALDADPRFYSSFMDIASMRAKHDWLSGIQSADRRGLAKRLAIFGGFVEGVQLFASFAILNNFPRRNLLKGMGQVVSWSIRDESLHSESISRLFRTIMEEEPALWTDALRGELYDACEHVVALEDAFVDTCFELGDIPGMRAADVKRYVRYMANIRLGDLGLKSIFKGVEANPFPWLEAMIRANSRTNFFEGRSTDYAKAVIVDDMPRAPYPLIRAGATS